MNTTDIILFLIAILSLVYGAYRGIIRQAGSIAGLVLGVIGCRLWGDNISRLFIGQGSEHGAILTALAYIIVFIGIYIVVNIAATFIGKTAKAIKLGFIDRIGGALFSLCLWMLIASICLNIYFTIYPPDKETFCSGKEYRTEIVSLAPKVLGYFVNHN